MLSYSALSERNKECFSATHPRGREIILAIELDLIRLGDRNANRLPNGRFVQVYTPPVEPSVEIRVAYLLGDTGIHIKVFDIA